MDVQFWAATDVGKSRDHNEDNFLVDKRLNLFIVCDGMGGHAAGEVASAIAVRAIRDVVSNNRDIFERSAAQPHDPLLRQDMLRVLEYAIQEACTRIFDMAQENPERRGMGTTCSLIVISKRRCFIAHVGDSRIYLVRKGQVHQLTEDHTLLNEMLRRGKVQEAEAVEAKYKNAITRAVGVYESVEVDTLDFDTLPGDRFMLCSDGLSGYLEEDTLLHHVAPVEIGRPSTQEELKRITNGLIRFANDCGGKDNITVILVGLSENSEDIGTDDVHLTMETVRNIPLFHYLSYKELVRIVNVTERCVVSAGEAIITEGEVGDELHIIMRGQCVVERGGQELTRLGPGRHFGEMALIDDGGRSATVRALTETTTLIVRRGEFYELLRKDPTLAVKLLWNFIQTLSSRLRDAPLGAVPAEPSSGRRRFEDAPTGSAHAPQTLAPQEFGFEEAMFNSAVRGVSDASIAVPSLSGLPSPARDDSQVLLESIRNIEQITGEEITLPGVKAEAVGVFGAASRADLSGARGAEGVTAAERSRYGAGARRHGTGELASSASFGIPSTLAGDAELRDRSAAGLAQSVLSHDDPPTLSDADADAPMRKDASFAAQRHTESAGSRHNAGVPQPVRARPRRHSSTHRISSAITPLEQSDTLPPAQED